MSLRHLLLSLPILIAVITAASAYLLWLDQWPSQLSQMLPHCRVIKYGTAVAKVRYPGDFLAAGLNGDVIFRRRDPNNATEPAKEGPFLMITSMSAPGTIKEVTDGSQMGPKYKQITFSDLPAGYNRQVDSAGEPSESYVIPLGDTGFGIDYQYSLLSPAEKMLADKLLSDIRISTTTQEVIPPRIDHCI